MILSTGDRCSNKKTVVAVIQARMSSKRFPGKVLLPFGKSTVLETIVDRVSKAKSISRIVIATSDERSDDVLSDFVIDKKIAQVFRGSLYDVHSRYSQLAKISKESYVLRITGDCPLTCFNLIDNYMDILSSAEYEFASNTHENGIIQGFNLEFIRTEVLANLKHYPIDDYEREHVTTLFYRKANLTKFFFPHPEASDLKSLNLSLDTENDYSLLNTLESKYIISDKTYYEIVKILLSELKG